MTSLMYASEREHFLTVVKYLVEEAGADLEAKDYVSRKYIHQLGYLDDDIDFYFEENNPENENEYKIPEGYLSYKSFRKGA